jgi:transcriptional regulator with XRE-family HTH domain
MSIRKKPRTPEQRALIELRTRMSLSQQEFSEYLKVSLPTVGNWETRNPPGGYTLLILQWTALKHGHRDLAKVFEASVERLKEDDSRLWRELDAEWRRWEQIDIHLTYILSDEYKLKEAGNPTLTIAKHARALGDELHKVRISTWRNRR